MKKASRKPPSPGVTPASTGKGEPSDRRSRSRARHRGAASRANADLTSHIESLGLGTVNEYRRWCREHGFTGELAKDWSQRRRERMLARELEARRRPDPVLQTHLASLGLSSTDEYASWCREHGFSESIHKTPEQRKRELHTHVRLRAEAAASRARRATRRPEETIRGLFDGSIDPAGWKSDLYAAINEALQRIGHDRMSREALLRLLLHAARWGDLLSIEPAVACCGTRPGNRFLDGLLALARQSAHWIREPEAWRPSRHHPRRQFGSLARHLLTEWPVPDFMDGAWFHPDPESGRRQQEWFRWIGRGESIRKADLPLRFTRRMTHVFPTAPDDYTIEQALRWSQAVGMGAGGDLARSIVATRLGSAFEEETFWETVVRFLVDHPMLDRDRIGPIVDYLHHMKFVSQPETGADSQPIEIGPPFPDLAMKGRSVPALLERVEEWHGRLAREARSAGSQWEPSGIEGFDAMTEPADGSPSRRWTVVELLSGRDLHEEGRAMSHCVGSYVANCTRGQKSVWSLGVEVGGTRKRVLTIAVKNDTRTILEVRGKRNVLPSGRNTRDAGRISPSDRDLLREGRIVMLRWARERNLHASRDA